MIETQTTSHPDTAGEDTIDRAAAMDRFEGDVELLREIAALFLEDCPKRLAEMREACAQSDAKSLERAAHSLKGSAGNFAAVAAVRAAARLEQMARAGDLSHAPDACTALEEEIARLRAALAQL